MTESDVAIHRRKAAMLDKHDRRWRRLAAAVTLVVSLLPMSNVLAATPEPTPVPAGRVRIAGIVLKWIRGEKATNFQRLEPMLREAAPGGAKIVCTTECFLDGYAIQDKSIPLDAYRALGEPIPGGKYIVFVHPAEFLVTDPSGEIVQRTILGDRLLIDPARIGTDVDLNRVFYFDLPLAAPPPK